MKAPLLLLFSLLLLTSEAATAARHPKTPGGKRAFSHNSESGKNKNSHMTFRHANRPAPFMDLKAHNPEKFGTVRAGKNYRMK